MFIADESVTSLPYYDAYFKITSSYQAWREKEFWGSKSYSNGFEPMVSVKHHYSATYNFDIFLKASAPFLYNT